MINRPVIMRSLYIFACRRPCESLLSHRFVLFPLLSKLCIRIEGDVGGICPLAMCQDVEMNVRDMRCYIWVQASTSREALSFEC
ncbi:hypothetical protein PILCRDRAFT_541955 [Piloderma croceum F 1598]|uniref:Uncharacterized protein n=1 Tax=Piloderma croceum (strain F 1598) TaxID=765440 RepID=A0A0C3FJJ7_PILCF|nr:hypothetical protein PILCRDRAFT_541955 [Piloderma croceum F 1598]